MEIPKEDLMQPFIESHQDRLTGRNNIYLDEQLILLDTKENRQQVLKKLTDQLDQFYTKLEEENGNEMDVKDLEKKVERCVTQFNHLSKISYDLNVRFCDLNTLLSKPMDELSRHYIEPMEYIPSLEKTSFNTSPETEQ